MRKPPRYPRLYSLIGKTADLEVGAMLVRVRIIDVGQRKQTTLLEVTPESGKGTTYVDIKRVVGAEKLAGA